MMQLPSSLIQSLILIAYILVGFIAAKAGILSVEGGRGISKLLVNVTLPALILFSMLKPFESALLGQVFILIGVSFAAYGLSIAFALLARPLTGKDPSTRGVYRFALVFSNVGFMGFPVMESLFGKDSLFQVAVYNIAFQVLAFSIGIAFLKPGGADPKGRSRILAILNPNIVAAMAGLVLFLIRWMPPAPVLKALGGLGDVTTPLSMVFIGSVLARSSFRAAFASPRAWIVSIFRIAIIPLALWLALRPLSGLLGFPLHVPVMIAAMPVAANVAILAGENGSDEGAASSLVTLSTLLSMLSIPVLARLLFGS